MSFWEKFDVEEAEQQSSTFEALPAGEYEVMCTSLEEKENKSGSGMHIHGVFTVTDGEYEGRLIFTNFNIINDNEKAQQIGRGELARFCRAVGVEKPESADDLKDIPLVVKVVVKEGKNEIRGYRIVAEKPESKPESKVEKAVVKEKPWKRK